MATGKYQWEIGSELPIIDAHSIAKHEVVRRYLRRYLEIRTALPVMESFRVTIVDGFAGGGLYRRYDTGTEHAGSPVLLIQEVNAHQQSLSETRRKPIQIEPSYHFVESCPSTFEHLERVLKELSLMDRARVSLHQSTFESSVNKIICDAKSHTKTGKAIFLLDQYGYKDVWLDTIRRIFNDLPQAEVIMTVATDWLLDFSNQSSAFQRAIRPLNLSTDALMSAGDSPYWRRNLEMNLHRALCRDTGATYYTPFFVVSPDAHRSYWLVHLSKHAAARNAMTQVHWDLQNRSAHYGGSGLQMFRHGMLGYHPDSDSNGQVQCFSFDEAAKKLTRDALLQQIPERLREHPEGISFEAFFRKEVNGTPATLEMIQEAVSTLSTEGLINRRESDGHDCSGRKSVKPGEMLRLTGKLTFNFNYNRSTSLPRPTYQTAIKNVKPPSSQGGQQILFPTSVVESGIPIEAKEGMPEE